MGYTAEGIVLEIEEIQERKTQGKKDFKTRVFVLEITERGWTETVPFVLYKEACASIEKFKLGDRVSVSFNLKGRKWTSNEGKVIFYPSNQVYEIEAAGKKEEADKKTEEMEAVGNGKKRDGDPLESEALKDAKKEEKAKD